MITQTGKVSLTFDDGPNQTYTPRILDILKDLRVHASFFLVGKNAEKFPHIVERIHKEGHDIGNHTYTHPVSPLFVKNINLIGEEIEKTNRTIKKIVGIRPLFFRPPLARWGISSQELSKQATQYGHISVGWTSSSLDWLGSRLIIKKVMGKPPKTKQEIILLHDGAEKSLVKKRNATVEMLDEIICAYRKRSFQPLVLTKLLGL